MTVVLQVRCKLVMLPKATQQDMKSWAECEQMEFIFDKYTWRVWEVKSRKDMVMLMNRETWWFKSRVGTWCRQIG